MGLRLALDWWGWLSYNRWLPNCGNRILSGVEDRVNILVKITGRKRRVNSDKQGLSRCIEDSYDRDEYVRSHPGRTSEVLKHREAAKRRHESGVEANTQTSLIGKRSNLGSSPNITMLLNWGCIRRNRRFAGFEEIKMHQKFNMKDWKDVILW